MNKILFIDTLTTGLHHERCAIYQIGGIICQENEEQIVEKVRFSLAVKPFDGARINENSLAIGSVTRGVLLTYPKQEDAFKTFYNIITDHITVERSDDKIYIAGFNTAGFDVPFISNWFRRNDSTRFRDCFYVQTIDLMCLAALVLKNERFSMQSFQLGAVASRLGISPIVGDRYSCLDNAETSLEMYKELCRRMRVNDFTSHEKTVRIIKNF